MDTSLHALSQAIKKILAQLKPQNNPLSFIIITGKDEQGKSALLKQSGMEEMPVLSEHQAKVYFNSRGILVELGENWLTNNKANLHNTFKQLNKSSRYLKITGLILCLDVNDLLIANTNQFIERRNEHLQLLARLGHALNYPIDLALILTKMDTLAGFSEFYQAEHSAELAKPLGFSIECINEAAKKMQTFSEQFNQFVELQNQQVIHKMHPARSTIKRSLIREFPLQLASLQAPAKSLTQGISPKLFNLHSLYFTSAEQGGISVDRLNKKIQHEYALTVQDTFPQAINFRAYFVEGALKKIQEQCCQLPQVRQHTQRTPVIIAASLVIASLGLLGKHYYKSTHLLDEASKELLAYDVFNNQNQQEGQALYHLSRAAKKVGQIATNSLSLPTMQQLKQNLHQNAEKKLHGQFLPALLSQLEQAITNPSHTPIVRYNALKIYLMFKQHDHFSRSAIENWFKAEWSAQGSQDLEKQLSLLKSVLRESLQQVPIKQQIINDARNYLNALPTSYLYYSLAKEHFPQIKQKIDIKGFNLATNELPVHYTKMGYKEIIDQLPKISSQLQAENWVLERQDLNQLPDILNQAYCFDYTTWWQTFIRKSQPAHYQDYQQGRQITHELQQAKAFSQLLSLIQQQTRPDLSQDNTSFNQHIANKFTELNLVSPSSVKELDLRITDLERFISTLSVVNDNGKTAFNLSKSRFTNDGGTDPLSLLYNQAHQLPEPLNNWGIQLASDTWTILIKDTRQYINQEWQNTVYKEFQNSIAKRYPFDANQHKEISIADFNRFFATHGILNGFTEQYIKPFLDTSNPQWKPKAVNDFVLPITTDALNEIIRANIITNMFFPNYSDESKIDFSLQKINLDPVIANLRLEIGSTKLMDNQTTESFIHFTWPQNNAKLSLDSIEGNHYELAEQGSWAIFKLLEKVNVLIDEQDSSNLQILFEINSNSGRYLLKANNQVNPFTPGILNGFSLNEGIV